MLKYRNQEMSVITFNLSDHFVFVLDSLQVATVHLTQGRQIQSTVGTQNEGESSHFVTASKSKFVCCCCCFLGGHGCTYLHCALISLAAYLPWKNAQQEWTLNTAGRSSLFRVLTSSKVLTDISHDILTLAPVAKQQSTTKGWTKFHVSCPWPKLQVYRRICCNPCAIYKTFMIKTSNLYHRNNKYYMTAYFIFYLLLFAAVTKLSVCCIWSCM